MLAYNNEELGRKINYARKMRGYSIKRLSHESFISINTIRSIERGTKVTSLNVLSIISGVLKVDLRRILYESAEESICFEYAKREQVDILLENRNYVDLYTIKRDIDNKLNQSNTEITNHSTLTQLLHWVNGLIKTKLNSNHYGALDDFGMALKSTSRKVHLCNVDYNSLDLYELEIINSIACIYLKIDSIRCGIQLLEAIMKNINNLIHLRPQLYVKVCYNLSSAYYHSGYYGTSEEYADLGIKCNKEKRLSLDMWQLLFRKGISQYRQGNTDYATTLNASRLLLDLLTDNDVNFVTNFCLKENIILE